MKIVKGSTVYFKFCFSILWVFCIYSIGISQNKSAKFNFDQLTIKDGLSNNRVQCILQDHNGYIWIGTANGLNKYDGYEFEVYRSNMLDVSSSGFLGKSITALYEDSDHNLWVGTAKSGINVKYVQSDIFINSLKDTAFADIKESNVTSIYEDRDGLMWFSTIGSGVMKYDPVTKTSKRYTQSNSGLSSDLTFDILQDSYGVIWVGASGWGINYLSDEDQFELLSSSSSDEGHMNGFRKSLCLDGDVLWIGTEGTGLYQINLIDKTTKRYSVQDKNSISSDGIKDILLTQDRKLFIATDGAGLDVLDKNMQSISNNNHQYDNVQAINSNSLLSLLEDKEGNIWVGTFNGGLNIYKPNKTWFDLVFPSYTFGDQLKNRSILSIAEDKNGGIYLGTDGGGLNYIIPNGGDNEIINFQKKELSTSNSISGNKIKSIYEDDAEHLWLGVFNEITSIYNPFTKQFRYLSEARSVWTIDGNSNGEICLGTIGEGLILYDKNTDQITAYQNNPNEENSIGSNLIMSVMYDDQDKLWIGTSDSGLDIYNRTSKSFTHYRYASEDSLSLSSDEVRAVYQDSKARIWIGTEGGGLNRWLGNGQFEHIGEEKGLIANSVMGICEDDEGMIWITTFVGISKYDPETKQFRNFDFRTSQNLNQFNQMAILATKGNQLYFGGTNGLHSIYSEHVKEPSSLPSVLFTDLEVSNKNINVGQSENGTVILDSPIEMDTILHLSYKNNSFSIAFSAVDYTNLHENVYSYIMEGFDDTWKTTKVDQHNVSYTNLDPGEYVFRVRYRENESSKRIVISPPFWQTTLFKLSLTLLSLALLISGILFLIRRREANYKRLMLRMEKEKLETSIEAKNSKLMFFAVQMAHKNEILTNIKEELKDNSDVSANKTGKLINKLDRELKNGDYWEDFNIYFNRVDQDFVHSIQRDYPALTSNDIRMCSLIRMNLSNKEIASLCNISSRGVEQSKYRLKKRLELVKDEDLSRFISQYKSQE